MHNAAQSSVKSRPHVITNKLARCGDYWRQLPLRETCVLQWTFKDGWMHNACMKRVQALFYITCSYSNIILLDYLGSEAKVKRLHKSRHEHKFIIKNF